MTIVQNSPWFKKEIQQALAEQAKQIFDLFDHEIYGADIRGDLPMTIRFTDYDKIKLKFVGAVKKDE